MVSRHQLWLPVCRRLQRLTDRIGRLPAALADSAPVPYLLVTTLLALTGYLWLFAFPIGIVAIAVWLPGAIAGAHEAAEWSPILLAVALMMLGAWVTGYLARLPRGVVGGRLVKAGEAPVLFQLVDELRTATGAQRIQQVMLNDSLNVRAVHAPRYGWPLGCRVTLVIGLPLMQMLSPVQFRAALAVPLASLAGERWRPVAWLAWLPEVWSHYRRVHRAGHGLPAWLMWAFFAGYAPLYRWWASGAMQLEDLRALHATLAVVPDEDAAAALSLRVVAERYLAERFWPVVFRAAARAPEPLYLPYHSLEHVWRRKLDPEDGRRWLCEAFAAPAPAGARQASFRARLDALGLARAELPPVADLSAAQRYLDRSLPRLLTEIDRAWVEENRETWRARYEQSRKGRRRLARLHRRARRRALGLDEALEYVTLARAHLNADSAQAVYRGILALFPDDARLHFHVGRLLIQAGSPEGVRALERAMRLDKHYVVPAGRVISEFMARDGRPSAPLQPVSALQRQIA